MIALEYILRNIILRSKIMNNLMNIDIWKLLSEEFLIVHIASHCVWADSCI